MKKRLTGMLLVGCMFVTGSINVLAQEAPQTMIAEPIQEFHTEEKKHIIPFQDLCCDTYDAEGNLISSEIITYDVNIKNSILKAGQTKSYYPAGDPNGFYLSANQIIAVSLNLSKATPLYISLENGSGSETNEKNPSILLKAYTNGPSRLLIQNKSGSDVTINGSIIY